MPNACDQGHQFHLLRSSWPDGSSTPHCRAARCRQLTLSNHLTRRVSSLKWMLTIFSSPNSRQPTHSLKSASKSDGRRPREPWCERGGWQKVHGHAPWELIFEPASSSLTLTTLVSSLIANRPVSWTLDRENSSSDKSRCLELPDGGLKRRSQWSNRNTSYCETQMSRCTVSRHSQRRRQRS